MVCIYCGSPTTVFNSRLQVRNNSIWRRRRCQNCNNAFTTTERAELGLGIMLSTPKEGLVPFLRDKLFLDIVASCKHRSTAIEDSTEITQIIINEALAKIENGSLSRSELVIVSANVLKRFDAAAATVYLAYHPL